MAIDYQRLRYQERPPSLHSFSASDTILYALAVGLGADPSDERQLPFVYEERLRALPTMALVLGDPVFWLMEPDTGLDWPQVLYGEIGIELEGPLPTSGEVVGMTTVDEIVDKGQGRGAILYTTRAVTDRASGRPLCAVRSTYICRGDGGFGGPPAGPRPAPHVLPTRAPDTTCDLATLPQAALLYRLTGDRNPLHADPAVARRAGFDRPILHGLCTFAVAGHALLRTLCNYDPAGVRRMSARFTRPVFPGETLRTEIWREGDGRAGFRCRVLERDLTVLDNGYFEQSGSGVGA